MLDPNSNAQCPVLRIGCDIVEIQRIARLLQMYPLRFISKIFTQLECAALPPLSSARYLPYIAKRFAAKEALSKAIGTGIGSALKFHDVEIFSYLSGQPYIHLPSEVKRKYQIHTISLSLSDERLSALAFCVLQ